MAESGLTRQIALRERTQTFAVEVARVCARTGSSMTSRHITRQLLRAATSVAANYRAACRSRSRKEFIAKIGVVLEECDESQCWLQMAEKLSILPADSLPALVREAGELTAIFTATRSTARRNLRQEATGE